ncbi:thioesterase family protein [Renibacterium salmoninarum ATCC 33209]|uniref:Thioesterase family protein n=1 Tax=Renibacterium salmoninarum (strain ATCC 33209 / DSM 20767 / JCM 11484 / NBRC 15589 / NCIMB 2235) TaxID=288705 RepID=A9WKX8_RENSM|nr:thioesterase family protein [Renibacterium salmoninarum ATCC 33209]
MLASTVEKLSGRTLVNAIEADSSRSKTVTWSDPLVGAELAKTMSGLAYMQAMIDGKIPPPPISGLMNMTAVSAETGLVTFACTPDESQYNPIGTVHGGLVCTLLDSVCGCAVQTTLPAGQSYTSLEIKINYLRPVLAHTGELIAVGRVTKPGSSAAFAEGEIRDQAGKLIATASSTLLVFPV